MAETSKIEWTDSTFNPWEGCQKVSPGCDHCYAEARNDRFSGGTNWGPRAPRRRTKDPWRLVRRWQKMASEFEAEHGRRRRVFCGSLCDIFDNAVPLEWTHEALTLLEACDRLHVQLTTKRTENIEKRVPKHWLEGKWPQHIGVIASVCTQAEANRIVPLLLALKDRLGIPWVMLSMEPLLEAIDLTEIPSTVHEFGSIDALRGVHWFTPHGHSENEAISRLDGIIAGGESGAHARPAHPAWIRSLRDQCAAGSVAFFFKQWGEWLPVGQTLPGRGKVHGATAVKPGRMKLHYGGTPQQAPAHAFAKRGVEFSALDDGSLVFCVGKKRAGATLDGREHRDLPEALAV